MQLMCVHIIIFLFTLPFALIINVLLIIFTDCNHLKSFVEVSKCTAENTEKILLSNLSSVGEEFAALIYHLPESTEFNGFHGKCKSVLEALKRRSSLTDYLVS